MKKAYVKPVFFAEEFEMTANVAGCAPATTAPYQVYNGLQFCGSNGHAVGKGNPDVEDYWEYAGNESGNQVTSDVTSSNAAFLFTSGTTQCDFVWNSYDSQIGVWKYKDGYSSEEYGSAGDLVWHEEHRTNENAFVDLINTFTVFFRGNNSGCNDPITINGGTPFSN